MTATAILPAEVSPVGTAAAYMCYLDPDDPVPGTMCGVNHTTSCAVAVVKAVLGRRPPVCPV
ncbi:MAG: hypothetical protein ACT4PT_02225 [Methanobacteriota archaeon]